MSSFSSCFILLLLFPLFTLLEPLTKAKRLAKKFENMCAVRKSVQERRRKVFFPQHGVPIAKCEVRGNDDGAPFVEG